LIKIKKIFIEFQMKRLKKKKEEIKRKIFYENLSLKNALNTLDKIDKKLLGLENKLKE